MKECWSEGELRAYLDGELPPEDMGRVAQHLEVCSECGDHWAELAGRAARVTALMDALPDPDRTVSISRAPRRAKTNTWRWAGAVAALAAGLVLGIVAMPKRPPQAPVVLPAPSAVAPAAADPVEPRVPGIMNAVARPNRARPARPVKRETPSEVRSSEDFVSLDDEPISTGVVLRVELGPKGIPADVIFGSDGRPHAIRLVNNQSNH
jgi:anti-sigma factor RsiW